MKIFDEWFRENSENAYARNMSRHEIAKQAYYAGMLQENDMKLGYDETKCGCCGRVYVNSLLMDLDKENEHFIVCLSCANTIYRYICEIRQVTKE